MRCACLAASIWIAVPLCSQAQDSETVQARIELDRIREMVDAGALPRKALDEARERIEEAQDNATLRATLYGRLGLEDMTELQARAMIAAAGRQWKRRTLMVEDAAKLVELGARPPGSLAELKFDVERARGVYDMAVARLKLFDELTRMVHAERDAGAHPLETHGEDDERDLPRISERFGAEDSVPSAAKIRAVETAFERHFGAALPVSARGGTELHKSMGFDHTGRLDVGLQPDSKEGAWLRKLLESMRVPYLAFRGAVPGQSTAAHIHIGPPSSRIRKAD
jgi:hypothetical protein